MPPATLTPVFVGMRTGLHVLVTGLTTLVVVRAVLTPGPTRAVVVVLALAWFLLYCAGGAVGRRARTTLPVRLWLLALTLGWIAMVWLEPEPAYLVFPLFFVYIHLLPRRAGTITVFATTAVAIVALGLHGGWSVAGAVGPFIGACVALLLGRGYQALAREAREHEELVAQLVETQGRLAATERESGVLAERARLAREIHDTVAQGLASIQLLLHAAERADPERGLEHVRLARETAATNLAETRRFIRELAPPSLDEREIGGVLRRLARSQWHAEGLDVDVHVPDGLDLPMHVQTALLRIVQGAVANVVKHAGTRSVAVTITRDAGSVTLTVADDGIGFDVAETRARDDAGRSDSFGLRATRERVEQLDGTLLVESAPGHGTTLTVVLAVQP
ncbi:sensor histidine kinase [Sanguibacter antarcticus]|uniref:Signal transduction histidine kinase n=1 Tax=Sanguibacter antarcticus TaxID=372484 RepID=A0A2A9E8J9_9MICO|nr:sensor histidine kinase [Sanguibacter antarcticus]PFG34635.1 signal transduction histidine kinase [Sanguibacter antarcticus]